MEEERREYNRHFVLSSFIKGKIVIWGVIC